MKLLSTLLFLGLVLSLCNLMKPKNASGPSGSGTSSTGGIIAEKAEPTAAQTAALAGGQTIKWDQQGMSWTIPPKWTKLTDERDSFLVHSPGGGDAANLIVNNLDYGARFPHRS